MHILIIPSWYPQAESDVHGSFFREQAQALRKAGCRVGVVALSMRSWKDAVRLGWRGARFAHADDSGVPTIRACGMYWLPLLKQVKTRAYLRQGQALFAEYVRCHGMPDVIHAHSLFNAGLLAKALHDDHNIPYVVTEHNTIFVRGLVTPYQRALAIPVVRSAARRFAVSQPFCAALDNFFPADAGVWEELPNIVHERFLTAPLQPRRDNDGFTFVSVALLFEKKGFDILLRAFAQAFLDNPSVRLEIGGDGPERGKLASLTHTLGLDARVRFLGVLGREDVVATLAAADALALGSHYETFGVIVVEALALGKPVVATRCGGPESIVTPEDGILVETGNVAALAAGLRELYRARDGYQAEAIRARCARRYGAEAVMRRLADVYRQVVTVDEPA